MSKLMFNANCLKRLTFDNTDMSNNSFQANIDHTDIFFVFLITLIKFIPGVSKNRLGRYILKINQENKSHWNYVANTTSHQQQL